MEDKQEHLIVAKDRGVVYGGLIQPFVVTREWLNQVPDFLYSEYSIYINGIPSEEEANAKLIDGQPWFKC
jgi:hypothetical protein